MKPFAITWVSLAFLALELSACGAFSDAAQGSGSDQPDGGPTLSFSPEEWVRQRQIKEFQISFKKPPPWATTPGAKGYISRFDPGSEDIQRITKYDGVGTVQATLQPSANATTGQRVLEITAVYAESGGQQQIHHGWGLFFVMPSLASAGPDGGNQ